MAVSAEAQSIELADLRALAKKISDWESVIRTLPEWNVLESLSQSAQDLYEETSDEEDSWPYETDYEKLEKLKVASEESQARCLRYEDTIFRQKVMSLPFGSEYFESEKRFHNLIGKVVKSNSSKHTKTYLDVFDIVWDGIKSKKLWWYSDE